MPDITIGNIIAVLVFSFIFGMGFIFGVTAMGRMLGVIKKK